MIRSRTFFSDEERRRIREAVSEAEKSTSGEIIPMVATASGKYERADDLVGLGFALITAAVLWWSSLPARNPGDWSEAFASVSLLDLLILLAAMLVSFIVGAAVGSNVAWLRRFFASRDQLRRNVERGAAVAFFKNDISSTRERTGILIYISLFERMVRVIGDEAIATKLTNQDWQQLCTLVLEGIRAGQPTEGIIAGIKRCGEILKEHFPFKPGDVNELSDELRTIIPE